MIRRGLASRRRSGAKPSREIAPAVGEGTPENVAEAAPVAAPAPVADTTPAL